MRRNIVAGNWKMNKTFEEADELLFNIAEPLQNLDLDKTEVILCPPVLYAEMFTDIAIENNFSVGAQNCSNHSLGAYTGEISAAMLKSMDIEYCLVGHSERRKFFNEDSKMLAEKVDQLLENEISPIFCCGEVLEDRESNNHFDIVGKQIFEGIFHLTAEELDNVVVAYEPVWAIGTGKTASPDQAQEMHAFIRNLIAKKYNQEVADDMTILYGGSCNAKNAKELFALKDVDGGLIGGASLVAEDFLKIVQSF
ncbi:MAG: triose-phosphate isomerase [Bacteroidales bacterium]|jgi:triosephosphate isomerase|nr:triose-phosphate isomerase [Bacteroidales bacterium]